MNLRFTIAAFFLMFVTLSHANALNAKEPPTTLESPSTYSLKSDKLRAERSAEVFGQIIGMQLHNTCGLAPDKVLDKNKFASSNCSMTINKLIEMQKSLSKACDQEYYKNPCMKINAYRRLLEKYKSMRKSGES